MSTKTTLPDRPAIEERAVALQRAAYAAHVELPRSYVLRLAATTELRDRELGASPLGKGVVIHTVPTSRDSLPTIVGYADCRGQWYRDGSRHVEILEAEVGS